MDSPESTMLLLQIEGDHGADSGPSATSDFEETLVNVLQGLADAGLVHSEVEVTGLGGRPGVSGGVPEYEVGRDSVTWWYITQKGRAAASENEASTDLS
jgi:hypothetical protein